MSHEMQITMQQKTHSQISFCIHLNIFCEISKLLKRILVWFI